MGSQQARIDRPRRLPGTLLLVLVVSAFLRSLAAIVFVPGVATAQDEVRWLNLTNGDRITGIGSHFDKVWVATQGGLVGLDKTTGARTFYTRANSGLPSNHLSGAHVAGNGDVWVWTWDSRQGYRLARFDGSTWTVYRPDSPALPFVPSGFLIDNRGHLWIYNNWFTGTRYLAMLDEMQWRVVEASFSLPGVRPRAVAEDDLGNLWVAVFPRPAGPHDCQDGGLVRFDGTTWTQFTFEDSMLASNYITTMDFDRDGSLWVGYIVQCGWSPQGRGGVSHYDGSNWTHFRTDNSGIPSEYVRSLVIDRDGIKWIGTDVGLVRFDGTNWTTYDPANSGLPSASIVHLHLDADDELWAGTADGGIARFDRSEWITYDTSNSPLPYSRFYDQFSVTAIERDHHGRMWMVLWQEGGVLRVDGEEWTHYTRKSGLLHDWAWGIRFDADDRAWFATPRGVAVFDGNDWLAYDSSNSPIADYASSVGIGPEGNVWVGTQQGLAKFDGTSWTLYTTMNSGLPSNYIETLAVAPNGDVYVSTRNPGNFGIVMRFDGTQWTEIPLRTSVEVSGHLIVDADGVLWADWPQGGMVRYDGMTTTFYDRSNSGLPGNRVSSFLRHGSDLWIGTENGLARFDGQNWEVFDTTNSGIAERSVASIALDTRGNLWIGHDDYDGGGLSIYRREGPPTSVGVETVESGWTEVGVVLSWRLGPELRRDITRVSVQRGETEAGPFVSLASFAPIHASIHFVDANVSSPGTYWYRLALQLRGRTTTFSQPVAVHVGDDAGWTTTLKVPAVAALGTPVPIHYRIGTGNDIQLRVFDVRGRLRCELARGRRARGDYSLAWSGATPRGRVPPGVYLVHLDTGVERIGRKLVLIGR